MLLEVGGVAQLARALASHVRGREFESHHLHHLAADKIIRGFLLPRLSPLCKTLRSWYHKGTAKKTE
jgi:hypothetical protein